MACLIVVAVTILVGRPTSATDLKADVLVGRPTPATDMETGATDLKTETAVRLVAFIYHMLFFFATLTSNEGVLCANKTCRLQEDYLHGLTAPVC